MYLAGVRAWDGGVGSTRLPVPPRALGSRDLALHPAHLPPTHMQHSLPHMDHGGESTSSLCLLRQFLDDRTELSNYSGGCVKATKQCWSHEFCKPTCCQGAPHHRSPAWHHLPHHPQEPVLGGHPRENHLQVHHPRAHLLSRLLHLPPLLLPQLRGVSNGEEPVGSMAEQPRHWDGAAVGSQLNRDPGFHRGVRGSQPDPILHVPDGEELPRPTRPARDGRVAGKNSTSCPAEAGKLVTVGDDSEGWTSRAATRPGDQQQGGYGDDRGDGGGEGGGEQGVMRWEGG